MVEETVVTSLRITGHRTIELFARLSKRVRQDSPLTNPKWPRSEIDHEKDRYELWAVNLGLFASGHGSLDYRLREADNLWETVQLFLQSLNTALEEAFTYWFEDQSEDNTEQSDDQDIQDEMLAQGIDSLDELVLDSIRDPINRLYRLSSWIRNPSTRAISKKALQHAQTDPDTGIDWLEAVKLFDYDYIRTKIWQLVRLTSSLGESALTPSAEETPSVSQVWLIDRLTKGNIERRRLFSYWRQHRLKLQGYADVVFKDTSHLTKDTPSRASKSLPAAVSLATSATRLQQPTQNFQAVRSTATISEYAPSLTPAAIERVAFPPPPKEDAATPKEFECPYCYTICPKTILTLHAWRAHLIHDLRPYMCTYETCKDSCQMYDKITDWIQHENLHRAVLLCPEHPDLVFHDKAKLLEHHSTPHKASKSQMMALIDQIGVSVPTNADRPCPMCLCIVEKMKDLQNHVAQHLVDLSLFSLPRILQGDLEEEMSGEAAVQDFGGMDETSRDDDFGSGSFHSYASRHSNPMSEISDDDSMRQATREQWSSGPKEADIAYDSSTSIQPDNEEVQKIQSIDKLPPTILDKDFNDLISNIESIAADLAEFQPYVPVDATIPALLSELYAISASLRDLHTASTNPRNFYDSRLYADARWAVVEALKRTLQDLDRFIKKRRDIRSGRSRRESYSLVWAELNEYFFEQDNYILFDRLNCFKLFLRELVLILKGNTESLDFQVRYNRIDKLLEIQDEDLSRELRRLELQRDAVKAPHKVKSWERKRPGTRFSPEASQPVQVPLEDSLAAPTSPHSIQGLEGSEPLSKKCESEKHTYSQS